MHDKIWFESEGENKGTTFYFTVPIAKAGDIHREFKELELDEKNRPNYAKSRIGPVLKTGLSLLGIKGRKNMI